MPKIKYDVSKIEDVADRTPAPVGLYRGKVAKCEPKQSKNGNAMLEVQLHLTHSGDGKKLKEEFADVWTYPIMDHEHPFVQAQWKEFIAAMGLKPKGDLDTDKLVGKTVQVKLKSDTDQDGEYRPRVGKLMSAAAEAESEAPADDEEPEEDEGEEEGDAEEGEEEGVDLADLDRAELKALIKEEGLDIKVLKKHSDDDLRELIAEAMGVEEEEEESDDEEEEDTEPEAEAEDDGYDGMSVGELKAELAERELPTSGARKILVGRLRKDDGSDAF